MDKLKLKRVLLRVLNLETDKVLDQIDMFPYEKDIYTIDPSWLSSVQEEVLEVLDELEKEIKDEHL